ncbi:Vacuolar protein 8 [Phytophthora cinnamomi]|uniref:Vacuolar protein 8 n=1 Tax=Phytophthora cinnamomi TaxID=4785 RepID=UPI00355A4007|nr:Vacuolar protein 8 [Phytophthora cinnamomi]
MGILVELKIPGWGSPKDVLSVVLQHADDMKEVRHVCTRLHQRLDGVFCAMKSKEINDEASQAEALDKFVAVLTKSSICFERYHEKRLVRRLVKYQTLMDDVHAINEDIDGLHAVLNVKPTDWRQQWEADKRAQQDVMEPIVLFNRLEVELIRQNGCASDQQNEVKPKTELKCCGACNASIAGEQCMCSSCGSYLFDVMVAATKEADSNQPPDSRNSDVNFANENATDSGAKMNTPETVHSDLESLESSQEDITHLLEHVRTGNEEDKRIATEELAKLVSHDKIRAHIMEEGILPPLIHLLRTGTDRQKAWATNALVEVSAMNDGTRAAVAREGVIPPLVALARDGTEEQKRLATNVLAHLSFSNDAVRVEIVREGAIPPLTAMVQTGTDAQKQLVVNVLAHLASTNLAFKTDIAKQGVIAPLVSLVRHGTDGQKIWSAHALMNLASRNDTNRAEILRHGAKTPLTMLVRSGTAEQKVWASKAMDKLSSTKAIKAKLRLGIRSFFIGK